MAKSKTEPRATVAKKAATGKAARAKPATVDARPEATVAAVVVAAATAKGRSPGAPARKNAASTPGRARKAAGAEGRGGRRRSSGSDAGDGEEREDERDGDGDDGGEESEEREDDGDHREGRDGREDGEVIEVAGELVDEDAAEPTGDDDAIPALSSRAPTSLGNEAALSRTDPLQAYLREVQRHSLLKPEEERDLTQRYYKAQDVKTAARLVTANLRLVVKLAYEYRRAYRNIMDLIQEGNIGLMQAVKRYDPYRGVKLSSYAAWWIRAYILRFILNNWRLVKLGTTQAQRKLFFNLNKEKARLSAMGIEPTAAEIARRLSVDEKEVVDMDRRLSSGEASLDAPVGDTDGRSVSRIDLLPSAGGGPENALVESEIGELVHDRLMRFRETLKGKDTTIFDKRMVAEDPLTLQELGNEFGISRERVRQLEARLTGRLREYLKEELGDAVGAG